MPLLWLTGPRDEHFPLDVQQASYRAAPGLRQISVPFDMKHGHQAGWLPPDSYAFAKAVVETGRPWARELTQKNQEGLAQVEFSVTRTVRSAVLIFKSDADWKQIPAQLKTNSGRAVASAAVPVGTSAYYFNLDADGVTLSSEFQAVALSTPSR